MIIRRVDVRAGHGTTTFEAVVEGAGAKSDTMALRILFHREVNPPLALGDPFLAALLVPCMLLGESLEVHAPVSPRLLESTFTIQKILKNWYPNHLSETRVGAQPVRDERARAAGGYRSACFFSGGVDSWYSLLQHRSDSPALITVKGFDIPYEDQTVWPDVISSCRRVAGELGIELIAVETNLRDCLDPAGNNLGKPFEDDFWGKYLHGAFLAAVGLCLQNHFTRIMVPSSYSYIQLHPWGSHPLLDPLWSTELVAFVHDGCEASRMDKLKVVAQSQIALSHLRVCFCFTPGRYNCGECEKCRCTMLALHLLGALERTKTFDRRLNLHALAVMPLAPGSEVWYEDMLEVAHATGNPAVVDLLRVMLGRKLSARRAWAGFKGRLVATARKVLR